MAKKAAKKLSSKTSVKSGSTSSGKLAGQTVAFIGKFGYKDVWQRRYRDVVNSEGGTVVDYKKKNPDYLWVGEGRGGKQPADVAKVQKKHPAVNVLETKDFVQLLMPDADTILRALKTRKKGDNPLWDSYVHIADLTNRKIALANVDLRKADLRSADVSFLYLDGADFREANVEHASFGNLDGANLSHVKGVSACFGDLLSCRFQNADLNQAEFFHGNLQAIKDCDLTGADLTDSQMENGKFVDCQFVKSKLQQAQAEQTKFERCDFSDANLTRFEGPRAKFTGCTFVKANLQRANLRNASLAGANLRDANLREAVLNDADLRGADLTGADLQNAVLGGAKLDNVDLSKAKNYSPPVAAKAGPKLKEFNQAAAGATSFATTANVELGKDEFARLSVEHRYGGIYAFSRLQSADNSSYEHFRGNSLQQAVLSLRERWPAGTLRLDSITAKGSKKVRGKALQELAVAAWAEAFGIASASPEQLSADLAKQQASALQERDELLKKLRKSGTKVWKEIGHRLRNLNLAGADLSNAQLNKLQMGGKRDLTGANFAGSSLVEAQFWKCKLQNVNFSGADLSKANLNNIDLTGANLANANLTEAGLVNSKLQAANLTGATLKDADLEKTQFDHKTIFPAGFKPPEKMVWKGEGTRPAAKKVVAKAAGSLDFADFIKALNKKVDLARMQKAAAMLKKEKFQLFAEVDGEALGGIVKSQTDQDLVYSCRLTAKGDFGCCTQNLNACGGLRGALCKHLLVLIIGLAKAGQLDSATVDNWINLSRGQKPKIDSDAMSATFLKYKGAEAGEIDWRPTETIPEDFYSM